MLAAAFAATAVCAVVLLGEPFIDAKGGSTPWLFAIGAAAAINAAVGWRFARSPTGSVLLGWLALAFVSLLACVCYPTRSDSLRGVVIGLAAGLLAAPTLLPAFFAFQSASLARPGSVLHQFHTRRLIFAWMASLPIVGWLASLRAASAGWAAALAVAAAAGVVALWVHQAGRIRRVLDLVCVTRPDTESSATADPSPIDLGVGDDRWVATQAGDHPYRRPDRVSLVLRGSPFDAQRHLLRGLVGDGLCAIAAVAAAVHAVSMRPAPVVNHLSAPVTVPVLSQPRTISTWAWYPQAEPILVDLNGDGTEDVVGLRWDSAHEEAALSIVATDGATFRPLWSTERIKSQWSSARTKLVRAGERLFLLDSERLLHVHALKTGRQLVGPTHFDAGDSPEACATRDDSLWVHDGRDWEHADLGTLVDGSGKASTARRPDECKPRWGRHTCGEPGDGPCVRKRVVEPQDGERTARAIESVEVQDVGVTFGSVRGTAKGSWAPRGTYLVGYDPKTGARRWENPLAFTSELLHADPRVHVELANDQVFGIYQLADGRWLLGARDATTGRRIWHREPPGSTHGTNFRSLHVSAQRLYVILDWRIEVFDPQTGSQLGTIGQN